MWFYRFGEGNSTQAKTTLLEAFLSVLSSTKSGCRETSDYG